MAEYRNSGKISGANLSSMNMVISAIAIARGRIKKCGEIASNCIVVLSSEEIIMQQELEV